MVFQEDMQYRADYIVSFLCVLFPLIAILLLWRTIFYEVEMIKGYTAAMMITYYVLAAFLGDFVHPVVWMDIASDIREGTLSNYLLRPISYKWHNFCVIRGSGIVRTIVSLPLIIGFSLVLALDFQFPNHLSSYLLFFLALGLAIILGFQLTYLFSLSAFWLEENTGMLYLVNFVIPILVGSILPLDLFPSAIYRIIEVLPFKYLLFFPLSIFLEKIVLKEIVSGLVIQMVWIIVIYFVNRLVWSRGIRKFSAYGG